MNDQSTLQKLLHIKAIIDGLKAISTSLLSETEREAVEESLDQAYDRAAYLLGIVRVLEIRSGKADA
jgi:hypothetical protein